MRRTFGQLWGADEDKRGSWVFLFLILFVNGLGGCPLEDRCHSLGYCEPSEEKERDAGELSNSERADGFDVRRESGVVIEGKVDAAKDLGASCTSDRDCQQRCLRDENDTKYCTQSCRVECPEGYACIPYEKEQVCARVSSKAKPFGASCRQSFDCLSRSCFQGISSSFCTKRCELDSCPDDMKCVEGANGAKYCIRVIATGKPCKVDAECEQKICLGDTAGDVYCSQECKGNDCPDGYVCLPYNNKQYCFRSPTNGKRIGDLCNQPMECHSRICLPTRVCSQRCENKPCPPGFRCVEQGVKLCSF